MYSGRALQRHLLTLGIPAQKIVRKQDGDNEVQRSYYVADFFVPEMSEPIAPAAEWAKQIREAMPNVRIIDTHDTIAVWRPNQPVIYATVIFQLIEISEDGL